MGKYIVEITDMDGTSSRIELTLPVFKNSTNIGNSKWITRDEGFLKFRSGGCVMRSSTGKTGIFNTAHLRLYVNPNHGWGISLNNFLDELGTANDSGGGVVQQPWVIVCKPGDIGWVLA